MRMIATIVFATAAMALANPTEAKTSYSPNTHKSTGYKTQRVIRDVTPAFAANNHTQQFSARRRHVGRGGACDGIHRCICGSTQTRHFGLPRIVNGHNLWQAAEWPRAFPNTTPQVGAVMYQHGGGPTGHVSRIVAYSGGCVATVADERGQYERNICSRGAKFVSVTGGGARVEATALPNTPTN